MERRKAVTFAALIAGGLLVGALAMTANAGILGAPTNDKVGNLSPVVATTLPTVIYIDDPAASTTALPSTAAVATPAAPTVSLDDGGHGEDAGHGVEHGGERDD